MNPALEERFRDAVIAVIRALRPAEVASYGEIASRAGHPGAARAVGTVLATTDGLPWWRVVRSDGTLAANRSGRQAELLRGEGVAVRAGRIADPAQRRRLKPDLAGSPLEPGTRSGHRQVM
jgi:methylated-DNA-protein-cysteine methyltransferase-like protein